MKHEYQHTSFAGTYWIDCIVERKISETEILIRYYDFYIEEYVLSIVDVEDVRSVPSV